MSAPSQDTQPVGFKLRPAAGPGMQVVYRGWTGLRDGVRKVQDMCALTGHTAGHLYTWLVCSMQVVYTGQLDLRDGVEMVQDPKEATRERIERLKKEPEVNI